MKEATQRSSVVMKSASEAASRTGSWSLAKQEIANRVISSGAAGSTPGNVKMGAYSVSVGIDSGSEKKA